MSSFTFDEFDHESMVEHVLFSPWSYMVDHVIPCFFNVQLTQKYTVPNMVNHVTGIKFQFQLNYEC